MEGSVWLRDGNHVTVNVQLIEASTDRHLWAKKFEGDVTNILKTRNEVVEDVAREIPRYPFHRQSSRLTNAQSSQSRQRCRRFQWAGFGTRIPARDPAQTELRYGALAIRVAPRLCWTPG